MADVAVVLADAFSGGTGTGRDLTTAEESVRGLRFDFYKEKVSCRVMTGIRLTDFEALVNSIARRLELPDCVREAILEGKLAGSNGEAINEFSCKKGETGRFSYGRIVTLKQDDDCTISLAYAVYDLEFKLSPDVTYYEKKKKFLCFTTGTKVWRETMAKDLSLNERDGLRTYFSNKAVKGFKEEFHGVLEGRTRHRVTDERSLKPAISYAN